MVSSRKTPRALALGALLLVSMAALTSTADAETGATWSLINPKNGQLEVLPGAGDLLPELQIREIENKTASLLFKTSGGVNVTHLCTEAELVGLKLQASGGTSAGKIRFKNCNTLLNGKLSTPCQPHSEGAPNGVVETNAASALIVLHLTTPEGSVVPILKLTPAEGEAMATMIMGEECAIGELLTVLGTLTLKDCENALATEQATHLIEEGPLTKLTVLGQPTTMDGSILVELSGAHKAIKWAGSSTAKKP